MVNHPIDLGAITFQGKHPEEVFQFYFRQHWIRLMWPFLRMLVGNILIGVIGYIMFDSIGISDDSTRHILLVLLSCVFLFINLEFLQCFYRYFLYVIVVTDTSVHRIKKTLFLIDDHQSIDLSMLQDIHQCKHGWVQNIFQYGSITLEAQETVLRLHFVPRIAEKYKMIMHLKETARRPADIL